MQTAHFPVVNSIANQAVIHRYWEIRYNYPILYLVFAVYIHLYMLLLNPNITNIFMTEYNF